MPLEYCTAAIVSCKPSLTSMSSLRAFFFFFRFFCLLIRSILFTCVFKLFIYSWEVIFLAPSGMFAYSFNLCWVIVEPLRSTKSLRFLTAGSCCRLAPPLTWPCPTSPSRIYSATASSSSAEVPPLPGCSFSCLSRPIRFELSGSKHRLESIACYLRVLA